MKVTTQLAVTVHDLVREMDSLADHILRAKYGVGVGLFSFLTPLDGRELDLTHLAKALNLTRAAASKRVPQLVRDGWVTTASDPNHKRRVMVSLTPKGAAMVTEGTGILSWGFDMMVGQIGVDGAALNTQLRVLADGLHDTNVANYDLDVLFASAAAALGNMPSEANAARDSAAD